MSRSVPDNGRRQLVYDVSSAVFDSFMGGSSPTDYGESMPQEDARKAVHGSDNSDASKGRGDDDDDTTHSQHGSERREGVVSSSPFGSWMGRRTESETPRVADRGKKRGGGMHRMVGTAFKVEVLNYLREEAGISSRYLTDTEYETWISMMDRSEGARKMTYAERYQFIKSFIVRNIKNVHNPSKTIEYMSYSYNDTLTYVLIYLAYLVVIYATCNRIGGWPCVMMRLIMTCHLGYLNYLWVKRICIASWQKMVQFFYMSKVALSYTPHVVFEIFGILFEVFIGYPLLFSIIGSFTVLYIMPIAFDQMALSSIFIELYQQYIGEIPWQLRLVSTFI